jgi:hypothetical protein
MKTLPVLDERATGIDVGSTRLHVSIGGDTPRVFGTMSTRLRSWSAGCRPKRLRSVALEATSVYWL